MEELRQRMQAVLTFCNIYSLLLPGWGEHFAGPAPTYHLVSPGIQAFHYRHRISPDGCCYLTLALAGRLYIPLAAYSAYRLRYSGSFYKTADIL